jgi:hypothetical protein
MRTKILICAASALWGFQMTTLAADTHPCASLPDDAQRLACYDSAFGKPVANASPAVTRAQPSAVPQPSPAPQMKAPSVAVAPPPPSPMPPPVPAKPREDEPTSWTAPVTAVDRLSDGRFVATLGNGQVWTQLETDSRADIRVGDTVAIKRAVLGSYMLSTSGGYRVRVRKAP